MVAYPEFYKVKLLLASAYLVASFEGNHQA